MKKILTIFMALLLCVGLAGCGSEEEAETSFRSNGNIKDELEEDGWTLEMIDKNLVELENDENDDIFEFNIDDEILKYNGYIYDENGFTYDTGEVINDLITADAKDCLKKYDLSIEDIIEFMKWYAKTQVLMYPTEDGSSEENSDNNENLTTDNSNESKPTGQSSNNNQTNSSQQSISQGQREALRSAKSYLNTNMAFSYKGLLEQLKHEGFSDADATYAVNNCGANWNNQALKSARSYLNTNMAFSYNGLIEQLQSEEFTYEEAVYGVNNCGADWNAQAIKSAQSYMDIGMGFSRQELINQLIHEGFTQSQAEQAVNAIGL